MTTPIPETAAQEKAVTRSYGSRGFQGTRKLFKISTLVLGPDYDPSTEEFSEKEIDIDERYARVQVTIEMANNTTWRYRATNLKVVLKLQDYGNRNVSALDQNISIDGKSALNDTLVLFDGAELFPGQALHRIVTVKTGIFSTDAYNRQAATPGEKEFPVTVTYKLEPFDPSSEGTALAKAFIVIAAD